MSSSFATETATARPSRPRLYLQLGRVSNLPTVWTNVCAGIALAGGSWAAGPIVVLLGALSLAYVGGMFLNDAFDREIDARERPERPIPSGAISAAEVFTVGFGLLAVAVGLVAAAAAAFGAPVLPPTLAALGLAASITLYDAWHKANSLSPALMGLCRAAVYVSAGLAAGGALTSSLLVGAASLLAYVVGLTAIARQENRRSYKGIVPLVFVASPIAVAVLGTVAHPVALGTLAVFVVWDGIALAPLFSRGEVNVPRSVIRLIAGISLLDGMLVAAHGEPLFGVIGVAGLAATLGLQRVVRGT